MLKLIRSQFQFSSLLHNERLAKPRWSYIKLLLMPFYMPPKLLGYFLFESRMLYWKQLSSLYAFCFINFLLLLNCRVGLCLIIEHLVEHSFLTADLRHGKFRPIAIHDSHLHYVSINAPAPEVYVEGCFE